LPQKAKILDIGAGFGKDVTYFCDRGFDCIGIDFCDEFIKQSKMLYENVLIYKMSFLEIDFPENTFDALWSRGALFHISKKDFHTVLGNCM
jgi:ubiquinone/menaquinone biosynthesis C-methylase UbiE